jgi:hypothetical protein
VIVAFKAAIGSSILAAGHSFLICWCIATVCANAASVAVSDAVFGSEVNS